MNTTVAATYSTQADIKCAEQNWRRLYRIGAWAALLVLLTAVLEIVITFLPGGYASAETVEDWFHLLQSNWFLGLRNLGLLNIVMTLLGIPLYVALYGAHRRADQPLALLAAIVSFIGVAVFYATNRAFSMLDLSHQYAAAVSDAQRAVISAAGQAMLAVGASHSPGTFMAFFLSEIAGILFGIVMLRGGVFSKTTGIVGLLAFSFLLIFEICSSFLLGLTNVALILALAGGLLSMAWYALVARRLFQL